MKICIVTREEAEAEYFEQHLRGHELVFVTEPSDVPPDCEIVSIFIDARIDAAFLEGHPALRLVANRSTSTDHIDLEACRQRNVRVASVLSYGDRTVAEHTIMLMLCLAKRMCDCQRARKSRTFSYSQLRGHDLAGKTLGILGCGRVGSQVARLGRAFRMRVLAFDAKEDPARAKRFGFRYVPVETILREADFISLHLPLNPQTRHILDATALAKCKPGVFVINTGRGALIDTKAMLEALDSGQVAALGLDVVEDERVLQKEMPHIVTSQIMERLKSGGGSNRTERLSELEGLMRSHQLVSHKHVLSTPHTAFNTHEAVHRINKITVQNIRKFAVGKLAP